MSLQSKKLFAWMVVCLLAISANAQKTGSKSTAGPRPSANQLIQSFTARLSPMGSRM